MPAAAFATVVALAVTTAASAAPPNVAKDLARTFFGNFTRAEVVSVIGRTLRDIRIDEGKVVAVRPNAVDLLERDGTRQTIPIGPATQLAGVGRAFGPPTALRGTRIVVIREGDGPATQIRASGTMRAFGKIFLGATLARAEILSYSSGAVHDYRLDEGRIVKTGAGAIVLAERDGSRQTIPIGAATSVTEFGQPVGLSSLSRGLNVLTIRDGDAPAQEVRILPGLFGGHNR